jgi:hypothetical protein
MLPLPSRNRFNNCICAMWPVDVNCISACRFLNVLMAFFAEPRAELHRETKDMSQTNAMRLRRSGRCELIVRECLRQELKPG